MLALLPYIKLSLCGAHYFLTAVRCQPLAEVYIGSFSSQQFIAIEKKIIFLDKNLSSDDTCILLKKKKVLSLFVSLRKMQILPLCYKRPGMPALDASGKCVWSVRNVLSRADKHCLGRSPHKRAPGMIKQKNSICDMICTVKSHSSCSQGSRKNPTAILKLAICLSVLSYLEQNVGGGRRARNNS